MNWSDITSAFVLNDNIICFKAFWDVFSTKQAQKLVQVDALDLSLKYFAIICDTL